MYFLNIGNIHDVKKSFKSLKDLCLGNIQYNKKWLTDLNNTGWLDILSKILTGAAQMAE